jgi:hypothetical protein
MALIPLALVLAIQLLLMMHLWLRDLTILGMLTDLSSDTSLTAFLA